MTDGTPLHRSPSKGTPSGAPPTLVEVAASLPGPVYTFASPHHLEPFTASAALASGRTVSVSVSYTFYRHPARREDPRNFVDLSPAQRTAIARADSSTLPAWLRDQIRRMRYPTLFEAVRTSLPIPAERAHPLEARLEAHLVDSLRSLFPGQPVSERLRTVRGAPLAGHEVRRGVPLPIDGEPHRSHRVEIAPHFLAIGARLDDRYVTAVIPWELRTLITPALETL
ncbi:hypothetical protein GTU73_11520 [Rathayibacter sp. VKM Ac-2804]|uniref:hypothetical protein n=1 Tax=Rathayibacter sp. VKM Ac-2804 TaxID=2609257 RepID=UPI00132F434B|nr:hypothetical protein [Rathayibacter sp. VKM Ac-2804]QHF24578.1 hypothetical protein GTU73_11520 [Rathayibacter sp. VKM Ac-2804]